MSFPFPTTWNELEEKHNHKNIKDIISKVTDNSSKNNESKKIYTKFQRNFKQEYPSESFKIVSDIMSVYQDELHNTSLKDENSKSIKRSVVPSSNKINKIAEDIFEENNGVSNSVIEEMLNDFEILDIDKE